MPRLEEKRSGQYIEIVHTMVLIHLPIPMTMTDIT